MKLDDPKSLLFYTLAYWTWKKDEKGSSVLPEMLYVFNIEDMVKFLSIFGGTTLKVPTLSELGDEMKEAIASYMFHNDKCSHEYIQKILGIDQRKYRGMMKRIEEWGEYFSALVNPPRDTDA